MSVPENITALVTIEDFEDTETPPTLEKIGPGGPWVTTEVTVDAYIQGTRSMGFKPLSNVAFYNGAAVAISEDFTDDYVWFWYFVSSKAYNALENKSNGGVRARLYSGTLTYNNGAVQDSTNNWVEYYIAGKDTIKVGWNRCVIHPSSMTPTNSNDGGDPEGFLLTAVNLIGILVKFDVAPTGINTNEVFMDVIHTGAGITFSGGTSGDPVTLSDISDYTEDSSRCMGICVFDKGVWRLNGGITAGVAAETTHLSIDTKIVVFEEQSFFGALLNRSSINNALHKITGVSGVSSNITITDSVVAAASLFGRFALDFNDSAVTVEVTNNTVVLANEIVFSAGHVVSGIFKACNQIYPNSAQFTDFIITGYSGTNGGIMWPGSSNIADGRFVNCTRAIEHDTAGSYEFDNLTFDDDTYDVHNSSIGTVNIAMRNGGNVDDNKIINSNGGTTNIIGVVAPILCTVVDDSTGLPIQYAHVLILKDSDKSQILSDATDSNGQVSADYTGPADIDIVGWVRQMDLLDDDYVQKDISGVISEYGLSLTIRLQPI